MSGGDVKLLRQLFGRDVPVEKCEHGQVKTECICCQCTVALEKIARTPYAVKAGESYGGK